jgi:hypothetical protein
MVILKYQDWQFIYMLPETSVMPNILITSNLHPDRDIFNALNYLNEHINQLIYLRHS